MSAPSCLRPCPICSSVIRKKFRSFDFGLFDSVNPFSKFDIVACTNCGFVYNDLNVTGHDIETYYSQHTLYPALMGVGSGGLSEFDIERYRNFLDNVKQYFYKEKKTRIVDVGCAKGGLLHFLDTQGYNNLFAIDISATMINEIVSHYSISGATGTSYNMPLEDNSSDILIFSNVFEHLLDFSGSLTEIHRVLNHDGYVIIEIPDAQRYAQSRIADFYWFSQSEHINHFTASTLDNLFFNNGFERVSMQKGVQRFGVNGAMPTLCAVYKKGSTNFAPTPVSFKYVTSYIEQEEHHIALHCQTVQNLRESQIPVYIWGKGLELQLLYCETVLPRCNIQFIIDNNPVKQKYPLNGISIRSQDILKEAQTESAVIITSALHKEKMLDYLKDISFNGRIISLV